MPLAPGTRLGPYEVLAPLGAGGMGEVYRAKDTKLKRDVALKVLPPALANDSDRLARFQREAEVLASLNHPNIAQIYGLEEAGGVRAIVMELVEGETLADVIKRGAIPVETAIAYAKQITSAFEYAHDKPHPVIHRDLKPANVQVTPEGAIKVLDFGLAKALSDEPQHTSGDPENSPTLTMTASKVGMVMGTAGYMSPEQAKAKAVDRRTDIWAFGVVLYEMVTGKRLFSGDDVGDILAAIVLQEPDLSAAPARVRHVIQRCLKKDPRKRWYSMEDIRFALDEAPVESAQSATVPVAAERPRFRWIPWALAAVLFLTLVGALGWMLRPSPPPPVTRFSMTLGEGQAFTEVGASLALSPDGAQMVYLAKNQIYLRSMADFEAHPISGTEVGTLQVAPTFSPDGKSLAFFSLSNNAIKRIAVSGGAAVTICSVTGGLLGMGWSEEGIVFSQLAKGIYRVSAGGGQPEPLIPEENDNLVNPQMLPGGKEILFQVLPRNVSFSVGRFDSAPTVVQTLKSGNRKTVLPGGSDVRYLPTGHLVYAQSGILFAVPFDARRLEVTGSPVPIVEGVARTSRGETANYAYSRTGSLIYTPGPADVGGGRSVLGLVDRDAGITPLKVPPGSYGFPRVSRDGKRVAYQIDEGKDASVWIYELSGIAAPRRLTLPGSGGNSYPIWSSDGERVAFQSDREGDLGIWWQRADGTGAAERLTKPEKGLSHVPDSWSPDGQTFSYTEEKGGSSEIWTYNVRDKKASLFAAAPGALLGRSVFSPDGHWMAYQISHQPNSRIYIRPFPPNEASYIAPEDVDSHHPLWFPDGKGLFYVPGPSALGLGPLRSIPLVAKLDTSGFAGKLPLDAGPFAVGPGVPSVDAGRQ